MTLIERLPGWIAGAVALVLATACAQDPASAPRRTAGAIATGGVVIDRDSGGAAGQDCAARTVGAMQGGSPVVDRGCTRR
ncbi:hypothetical protein [Pseudorhodoferax sp.]|uniref:hypothetical protein n=1 Tax=Pseudorhodoferax sp. TaxID=1993553 RepID=UPI002DD64449|nr:hypothetical protein [Pseudorhodoferax sp.]